MARVAGSLDGDRNLYFGRLLIELDTWTKMGTAYLSNIRYTGMNTCPTFKYDWVTRRVLSCIPSLSPNLFMGLVIMNVPLAFEGW